MSGVEGMAKLAFFLGELCVFILDGGPETWGR